MDRDRRSSRTPVFASAQEQTPTAGELSDRLSDDRLRFNGFLKTKYRYTVNGKVTLARIDLGGRRTGDHNIRVMEPGLDNIPFRRNELSPTEIVLDEPVRTDTIKIGILGDIPGIKYYDTAISEIEVYGIN